MDVYAQLEQRAQRSHGTAFDRIVRAAREQLEGRAQLLTTTQTFGLPQRKSPDLQGFFNSGGGIRTRDLRVMRC
jgi:hypothetical protein